MLNKLKRNLRNKLLGYDVSTYFFSQSGEDQIAYSALSNIVNSTRKGFYIDIGAYHPTRHSNTYLFYRLGWSGINIDARKGSMEEFDKLRPRDINIEMGVGLHEGTYEFNEVGTLGLMNSFSKQNLGKLEQLNRINKTYEVPVKKLSVILDEYCPKNTPIDLLSIDVEGMDLDVLKSNNWTKYYPTLIIVEVEGTSLNECMNSEITRYLEMLDYSVIGKTIVTKGVSSILFISNIEMTKSY